MEGETLDFEWRDGGLFDLQSGSEWDETSGVAIHGPRAGQSLELVAATPIYWSTWVAFHPETALF